jgi:hypothetical protein
MSKSARKVAKKIIKLTKRIYKNPMATTWELSCASEIRESAKELCQPPSRCK